MEWVRENTYILRYCGRSKPWDHDYCGKVEGATAGDYIAEA